MQTAASLSLGDLPLVVLSGDHHVPPYTDWRDLAQLSSQARQLVVADSGHWIHLDRPEIATQAIREVVAAARSAMLRNLPPQPHQMPNEFARTFLEQAKPPEAFRRRPRAPRITRITPYGLTGRDDLE